MAGALPAAMRLLSPPLAIHAARLPLKGRTLKKCAPAADRCVANRSAALINCFSQWRLMPE
jgi:hypothetical protein